MEFFSRDAGQARRAWLNALADGAVQFVPPELRPWLGIANELNPVVSIERAGTNALAVADPNVRGWDKVAAIGNTASNMANALAPVVLGSSGAVPAANAVEEALMGFSAANPLAFAARDFVTDEFGGVGFRAYQGSPHDFNAERLVRMPDGSEQYIVGRPDVLPDVPAGATVLRDFPLGRMRMDKIGTGEGAQAYGHGIYAAENEGVAQGYRDALAPGMGDGALRAIGISDGDLRTMRQFTQSSVDPDIALRDWLGWTGKRETPELRAAFMQEWNGRNPGRMYEVQINADPNDFLDWDKPLSEQPAAVRALASSAPLDGATGPTKAKLRAFQGGTENPAMGIVATGQDLHRALSAYGESSPAATEAFRSAGIPGIRYLDAGSRGAGDGSRNYVVFDDKLIEIIRKYGWAAAAPIFAASGLTVEEAQAQYEGQM